MMMNLHFCWLFFLLLNGSSPSPDPINFTLDHLASCHANKKVLKYWYLMHVKFLWVVLSPFSKNQHHHHHHHDADVVSSHGDHHDDFPFFCLVMDYNEKEANNRLMDQLLLDFPLIPFWWWYIMLSSFSPFLHNTLCELLFSGLLESFSSEKKRGVVA